MMFYNGSFHAKFNVREKHKNNRDRWLGGLRIAALLFPQTELFEIAQSLMKHNYSNNNKIWDHILPDNCQTQEGLEPDPGFGFGRRGRGRGRK